VEWGGWLVAGQIWTTTGSLSLRLPLLSKVRGPWAAEGTLRPLDEKNPIAVLT
jgi:hypothetical protein